MNCANNGADNAESAGEAFRRQPHAFEGRASASALNEQQYRQQAGGFGRDANASPDHLPQQQQNQQAHQAQQSQQPRLHWVPFDKWVIPRHLKMILDPSPANVAAALEEFRQETGIQNPDVCFADRETALEMQKAFERSRELVNRGQAADSMHVAVPSTGDQSRRYPRMMEGTPVTQPPDRSGERVNANQPVQFIRMPNMDPDDTSGQASRETQDSLEARSLQRFRERVNNSRPVDVMDIPVLGMGGMSRQSLLEMRQHLSAVSTQRLRERINRNRDVDTMSIPVMARNVAPRPAQPQQQQAGHGALPGARNAPSNRTGATLLGNYRVEKPGAAQGQGRQQRQRTGRGARGGRPVYREEDDQSEEEYAPDYEHHVSDDNDALRTDSPSVHDTRSADQWRRQQPDSPGTGGDDDVDFDLE